MLDDLRNNTFEEEEPEKPEETPVESAYSYETIRQPRPPFLGMTAPQRFILSLMLFMMVCMVGMLMLVVMEKVVLPF